jgi:urease accessory protein
VIPSPAAPPPEIAGPPALPLLERATGTARVGFALRDGRTRLATLFQAGSAKVRLPRVHAAAPTAVFINTAGGLTGGDRISFAVDVAAGADAVATTQAAERLYRRRDGVARVETRLAVGPGARLDWLPQETIVFDGAGLDRTLSIALADDARLLAVEAFVLGRTAMGERVRSALLADRWRVHRGGRLVLADALRLDGDAAAILAGPATGGGATAFATLMLAGPDAAGRRDGVRAALAATGLEAGASLVDGICVARLVAGDATALRRGLAAALEAIRGEALPRVWSC